jgi:cellulose synthase/poly-beta-1,6-N-acetylglucosamine synthase-like glycosyltransferase
MGVFVIVLSLLTAPIVLAWLVLTIELLLARPPRPIAPATGKRPRFAIVIPAHNEEASIGRTLDSVTSQLEPGDRCVVVADNCDDRTAAVASRPGVEVVVRHDARLRGKGYALQAGVEHLRSAPPAVMIVVDADCQVVPGSLDLLARDAAARNKPVQGGNLLNPPANAGPRDQLSAFAFRLKNHVRPLGLARCGGPCLLFGTGMALPWSIVGRTSLATGNSVEDMNLAIDLALVGETTTYNPIPTVLGDLPSAAGEAMSQRKRWEHGHVRTAFRRAPKLLAAAVRQCRWDLFLLAVDLTIPPLALLVAVTMGLLAVNAIVGAATGIWWGAIGLASVLTLGGLAMVKVWRQFGRDLVPGSVFAQVPFYVLRKIPIYAALLRGPQRGWQPTATPPTGA